MKRLLFCLFSFLFLISFTSSAEDVVGVSADFNDSTFAKAEAFEQHLQQRIQKVMPASVHIITYEHLAGRTGMSASGVCVSEDGIIMTAGHMTVPNGYYEITFPDGTKVGARGLGKIGALDAGLLKISKSGKYPYAEMGYSAKLEKGDPCFSLAYPGSFGDKMVARLGFVEEVKRDLKGDVKSNYVLNTCLMEPGDSGGPLFDIDGKVIGIRSYIGLELEKNYDVPVEVYRTFWEKLMEPVNYSYIPVGDTIEGRPKLDHTFTMLDYNEAIEGVERKLAGSFVKIISGEGRSAMGTVINPKSIPGIGKSLKKNLIVISKNSEIGEHPVADWNGKKVDLQYLGSDDSLDLVLFKMPVKAKDEGLQMDDFSMKGISEDSIGEVIFSPVGEDASISGIIGTVPYEVAAYFYAGYLGVRLETEYGKNIITHVQEHTAAWNGGIRTGDVINTINGKQINQPQDFISELTNKKPGDKIVLVRVKDGKTDTLDIILSGRPFQGIGHVSDRFPGGRSIRRDGFQSAFVHDMYLRPGQSGSPIFNLNGKLVGINIARYSRIGSYAIPAPLVAEFVEKMTR